MIKLQHTTFTEPSDPTEHDSEPVVVHARSRRLASNLVLLIHGLTGHRYGYWGNTPAFIMQDLKTADVGLYYYRTAWKRFGFFKSIDVEDEARVLADALRQLRRYEAITLVGHSMGGLLAKASLVDLIGRGHDSTLRRIAGLVLLACPQLGSQRVPRLLQWISRDGRALVPHNKAIRRVDTMFAARLSIEESADPADKHNVPTWATVAAEDFWVDALSAGIGIPEKQKLTVRGSHGSIIQPPTKDAAPYVFLRECLDTSFKPPKSSDPDAEEVQVEDAQAADVPSIRNLAVEFFGEGVTPEDVLIDFAAAGDIFRVVKRVILAGDERRERLSGYFCVIPLSRSATVDMKAGTLRGNGLSMEHVPSSRADTAALYIGAIAARDHYSRAVVLEALRLHVRYSARALGIREVLARPLTKHGLRLVRDHRFKSLSGRSGLDELYMLTFGDVVPAFGSRPSTDRGSQ